MTHYFVTSTGTGIGKTFVTAALAHHLKIPAYKPMSCGGDEDSLALMAATGQSLEATTPWRYAAPLAPSMAAPKEGKRVNLDEVVTWCKARHGLIEGVGGIMVPLNERETVLDWMKQLNWPLILVVGSYLGSISHTLTALEVLKTAKLDVRALIISESLENNVGLHETRDALAPFAKHVPQFITLPRADSWKTAQMEMSWLR
ncbi:MAG: dethiobiotin synthase [Rickettsiales bacterium]